MEVLELPNGGTILIFAWKQWETPRQTNDNSRRLGRDSKRLPPECKSTALPLHRGCKNPRRPIVRSTTFCTAASTICGSSEKTTCFFMSPLWSLEFGDGANLVLRSLGPLRQFGFEKLRTLAPICFWKVSDTCMTLVCPVTTVAWHNILRTKIPEVAGYRKTHYEAGSETLPKRAHFSVRNVMVLLDWLTFEVQNGTRHTGSSRICYVFFRLLVYYAAWSGL